MKLNPARIALLTLTLVGGSFAIVSNLVSDKGVGAPTPSALAEAELPACDPPATSVAYQSYQTGARTAEGSATFHLAPANAPCREIICAVSTDNEGNKSAPDCREYIIEAKPTPTPSPTPTPTPQPGATPTPQPCPPGWRKKGWCR